MMALAGSTILQNCALHVNRQTPWLLLFKVWVWLCSKPFLPGNQPGVSLVAYEALFPELQLQDKRRPPQVHMVEILWHNAGA